MTRLSLKILVGFLALLTVVFFLERKHLQPLVRKLPGLHISLNAQTVEGQVATIGPSAHRRLAESFRFKGVEYPPDKLALLVLRPGVLAYTATSKNRLLPIRSPALNL
jgi:hypothetical protein